MSSTRDLPFKGKDEGKKEMLVIFAEKNWPEDRTLCCQLTRAGYPLGYSDHLRSAHTEYQKEACAVDGGGSYVTHKHLSVFCKVIQNTHSMRRLLTSILGI